MNIDVCRTVPNLRDSIKNFRSAGETVALVPTMGALHEGHMALVRLAKSLATRAVVSIFVNPMQFAPNEDLARYPRDEAGDRAKLATVGADLVWSPDVAIMYPDGFATRIVPEGAAAGLEGEIRPHHFGGVATVCCKLFSQVTPDIAIFGEKDFQQLAVLRQMVRDLDLPLTITGAPTSRADDGLALSSRNAYLTTGERQAAPVLFKALTRASTDIRKGTDSGTACKAAADTIIAAGFSSVDYVEVRDAETLGVFDPRAGRSGRVLAAARLGKTRLIDNVAV